VITKKAHLNIQAGFLSVSTKALLGAGEPSVIKR